GLAVDGGDGGLVVVELAGSGGHRLLEGGEHLFRIDVLLTRDLSDDRRINEHRKCFSSIPLGPVRPPKVEPRRPEIAKPYIIDSAVFLIARATQFRLH